MKFIINKNCGGGGIYKITNNKDTRLYIGRTKNFKERAEQHRRQYENLRCNRKIRAFIKAFPDVVFCFEVIERNENIKEAEEKYIKLFDSVRNGFNLVYNDEEVKQKLFYIIEKRRKEKRIKERQLKESKKPKRIKEPCINLCWLKGFKSYKQAQKEILCSN